MAEIKKQNLQKVFLRKPHLSEKATFLKDAQNAYVFVVGKNANKKLIAKEIELMYKVNVLGVKMINSPSKPKSLGRSRGKVSGFKKALVTIKSGQTINII